MSVNLVIDIGNSLAKLALFEGKTLLRVVRDTSDDLDMLDQLLAGCLPTYAIVSAVVKPSRRLARRLEALGCKVIWLDGDTSLPVKSLYATPETLGSDRIAAVVGAADAFPGADILVIDAGTCITFDFIDASGCYHGGNIAPGVQMRFEALHRGTGRLPRVDVAGDRPAMGISTETAIRSGVLRGIEFEISGYIASLMPSYPALMTVLTGGDCKYFELSIKNRTFADKFLVLKGLNCILEYNNGKN